ncbi:MAG: hypothetical protein ACI4WH_02540 [Oscillospiraceae bacterium]
MGFFGDLFSIVGEGLSRTANRIMDAQDEARGLSPEQIAYKMEHSNVSVSTGYGNVLKEKYQAMSSNQQSKFIDYLIKNDYRKAFNIIKDL